MRTIRKEARAALYCVALRPHNSNPEKYALWAAMAVWLAGAVGILFGFVVLDSGDKVALWTTLTGLMGTLYGRAWKNESEHTN